VFEIILAGGVLMIPILACSVVAMAIVAERFWSLRSSKVIPRHLVAEIWLKVKENNMKSKDLKVIKENSALGRILAAGLSNMHHGREQMKEAIEDVGRHEAHKLERYLTTLGTIAAVSPLLGLLGTVIGMIKVFATISAVGVGNAGALSTGISEALVTTAAGMTVAIPALICFRHLRAKVDGLVVFMEQEALKLIEVVDGHRSKENLRIDEAGEL
jgi:biopolymer transport protein ExbB